MNILSATNEIKLSLINDKLDKMLNDDDELPIEEVIDNIESIINEIETDEISESLESIISKIVRISLGSIDIILGFIHNTNSIILNIMKTVPKSELQTTIAKHKTKYLVFSKSKEYSKLSRIDIPTFPFTLKPIEISNMLGSFIDAMNIKIRINSIIEVLKKLNESLRNSDIKTSIDNIAELNDLAIREFSDKTVKQLNNIIIVKLANNYETFGSRYKSINEFTSVVDNALKHSDELNNLVYVHNKTNIVYKLMEELKRNLSKISSNNIDISKLKSLPNTLFSLGKLIATYAILVKEYHHLEHNLAMSLIIMSTKQF